MRTETEETNISELGKGLGRLRSLQNKGKPNFEPNESKLTKKETEHSGKSVSLPVNSEEKFSEKKQEESSIMKPNEVENEKMLDSGPENTKEGYEGKLDMEQLRKDIWMTMQKLRRGEIDPKIAQQMLKGYNQIIASAKIQMELMKGFGA